MLKINLFVIVIVASLLGSCSFHTPKNNIPINASMTGDTNSKFVTEFKKHLDANAKSSLHIEIGKEIQRNTVAAYKKNGDTSSYILTLSVPIKVLRDQKTLLSKKITANTSVKKMESSQADSLQIERNFINMRKTAATKLARILRNLNAN